MKFSCASLLALALITGSSAFVPPRTTSRQDLALGAIQDRRQLFQSMAGAALATFVPSTAKAGLLDEFGADPVKIAQKATEVPVVAKITKGESGIDPTLRASYYYPTAKKRYLPRIQKVSNAINNVPPMIDCDDWEQLEEFYKMADNAILPMKLYVSSLDGQGLSMSNSYAKTMKADSDCFEKECMVFKKAIQRKDKNIALLAVSEMGQAVTDYRRTGRLTDDDGNIPSVEDLRRMAMRKPTGNY